jgi:hypothetical protein
VRARIAGLMAARRNGGLKAKYTLRRKLGIGAAVLVVLAGVGVGLAEFVNYRADADATCMNQGVTIVTHQGPDCVGITDGSYQFDPASNPAAKELSQVEKAIKAEDARVRTSGRGYVSIAYLMPISATGGVEPIKTVAEQLQGAYTAQYYANRNNVEGTAPLIQLLIASSGTQANEYLAADHEIESYVNSQHLVAVAGIGVSLDNTISEVRKLAGAGIPVFGASITSDAFDNIKNMVRSSPSNQATVDAALRFIRSKGMTTAFLIEDTNPSDSYDMTIVNEFRNEYPDHTHHIIAAESYNTTGVTTPSSKPAQEVDNRIGQMTSDICYANASVVLFAGRGRELATLLTDLGTRPCLNHHITVVTGPDVTDMPFTSGVAQGLSSGVSLYYAGEANPGEWKNNCTSPPAADLGCVGFATFSRAFSKLFKGVSDNDSNAMMGYDGTLTSIYAIRLAGLNPTPGGVIGELSALQGTRVVHGASGPISLSANYLNGQGSNPVGKPVPVLQLTPKGTISFVQLEWPDGTPLP